MKLLGDLQTIRKERNEQMLAVRARHNKVPDQLVFCIAKASSFVTGRTAILIVRDMASTAK